MQNKFSCAAGCGRTIAISLTTIGIILFSGPSPLLAAPKEELEQTKQEMANAKAHAEQLAKEDAKIAAELRELQQKLVASAALIQNGEAELTAAESKLSVLASQAALKNEALEAAKKHLESLVHAALRLSRTPPEAVVMMPGDSTKTMKAARALTMATSSIKTEAENIKLQVEELRKLQTKVESHKQKLMEKQQALDRERKTLKLRLSERKALQEKLDMEQREEAQKLSRLAKKAADLQELMATLREAQKTPRPKARLMVETSADRPAGTKGKLRSFATAKGKIRAPLSGSILRGFGAQQGKNETSKGLVISARTGAEVTSPYDGEVVFTGPFLGYGKMVIVRHSDEFHTLLAGLAKIDVRPGDFLLEGEPIGAMGEKESENRLYVELRKDNVPVDPAPWISGLKKSEE